MKNLFKNQNGQINLLGIIGISVSIAVASLGGWLAQNYRTDAKIDVVKIDISANSERTAKVEEAISTLKADNVVIKQDLKEILKILK